MLIVFADEHAAPAEIVVNPIVVAGTDVVGVLVGALVDAATPTEHGVIMMYEPGPLT